jgi:hypothetical protein
MSSYTDEDAQRKGIVNLVYVPESVFPWQGYRPSRLLEHLRRVGKIVANMPIRISSYHFCYQDPRVHVLLATIQRNFGKYIRLHIRTHVGA